MSIRYFAILFQTLVLALSVEAIPIYEMQWGADGSREYVEVTSDVQLPQRGFRAYDNWRSPGFGGGNSSFRSWFRMNGHEFGDDAYMTTTGPALLTDMGYSIGNLSTTQTLQSVQLTLRIYDENRALLFTDPSFTHTPNIPPGGGVYYLSNSNFYVPFNITLPSHVFISMQFSNAIGVDIADVGCALSGPVTSGHSSQFAYNFTTGETLSFDGSDQTNMKLFIDTAEVPSSSVATIFCLSALPVACRRRR